MRPRLHTLASLLFPILSAKCAFAQSAPSIKGPTPTGGRVWASVTVTSSGFGAAQGSSSVTFNGLAGSPTIWSDASIGVAVPAGATTGYLVVTAGGAAENRGQTGPRFSVINCRAGRSREPRAEVPVLGVGLLL